MTKLLSFNAILLQFDTSLLGLDEGDSNLQGNVKRMPSIKMTFGSRIGGGGTSNLHEAAGEQGIDKKHKKKVSGISSNWVGMVVETDRATNGRGLSRKRNESMGTRMKTKAAMCTAITKRKKNERR